MSQPKKDGHLWWFGLFLFVAGWAGAILSAFRLPMYTMTQGSMFLLSAYVMLVGAVMAFEKRRRRPQQLPPTAPLPNDVPLPNGTLSEEWLTVADALETRDPLDAMQIALHVMRAGIVAEQRCGSLAIVDADGTVRKRIPLGVRRAAHPPQSGQ